VFFGLRREPADVCGLALEEIGHEDTVFLLARGSEDIGTLNCLREEAEDVCFSKSLLAGCLWAATDGPLDDYPP
jgi:hypothetical protein